MKTKDSDCGVCWLWRDGSECECREDDEYCGLCQHPMFSDVPDEDYLMCQGCCTWFCLECMEDYGMVPDEEGSNSLKGRCSDYMDGRCVYKGKPPGHPFRGQNTQE